MTRACFTLLFPERAASSFQSIVGFATGTLDWYFMIVVDFFILFCSALVFLPHGSVRLGVPVPGRSTVISPDSRCCSQPVWVSGCSSSVCWSRSDPDGPGWVPDGAFHLCDAIRPAVGPLRREDDAYRQSWTIFYWARWISWAPFVGMFLAWVSWGRTIREFVTCVLLIPSLFIFIWMGVFGGVALDQFCREASQAGSP